MHDWVDYFKTSERNLYRQAVANRRLIELILERTPPQGRILEAGCGTGLLSVILSSCGFDVVALDLDRRVLDYGRNVLGLESRQIQFVEGDILKLDTLFEPKAFDTTCHSGVMEHFSDRDIVASLAGQRVVSRKVIFRVPNGRNRLTSASFGDERFLQNRHWVRLIHEAGFGTVRVFGDYDLPRLSYFLLPGFCFNRRFSAWWKWASPHSIFLCE